MRVENRATASFVMNHLTDITKGILVQEYLPPEGRTDVRAFVLGDRVVGAMSLKPDPERISGPIFTSPERGEKLTLDPASFGSWRCAHPCALGLEISGCDIILQKEWFTQECLR